MKLQLKQKFLILFMALQSLCFCKIAPGSSPPKGSVVSVFGADITPTIYRDTVDGQNVKVAIFGSIWEYEKKATLYGKGMSVGFEGEWGKHRDWLELRFFIDKSLGLYFIGHKLRGEWSFLYSNFGGVSIGPILEISTRSWLSQGLGIKADVWHMIGPIGIQFDVRLLTSKGIVYTPGFMARLAMPIYY